VAVVSRTMRKWVGGLVGGWVRTYVCARLIRRSAEGLSKCSSRGAGVYRPLRVHIGVVGNATHGWWAQYIGTAV